MTPKFHTNNTQNAQAMLEFALVLPILLLLIFGIFAFGHLFFTYSMVVAASREAARSGASVGLTNSSLPRYRDCNDIRDAGVRVGSIAGVTPESITVQYDGGVRVDGTPPVIYPNDCPIDGIGPGYIELGDRIVVSVTVNYRPIVPLVNFDEFPLVAETRRTIIIGMPVGEITPAVSLCTGTITRILPLTGETFEDILVGEHFSARLEVISDDPALPAQGLVSLYFDDPAYANPVCSGNAASVTNCSQGPIFWSPVYYDVTVPHILRARYNPGANVAPANPCFNPSLAEPVQIILLPAPTITSIVSVAIVATDDGDRARVDVNVIVDPASQGSGIPTGHVLVSDEYGHSCTVVMVDPYSSGYCDLELTEYGYNRITAVYNPYPPTDPNFNPNFLSSSAMLEYINNTPTPSPTPTIITPDVTMIVGTREAPTETPGPILNKKATSTVVPPGK